MSERKSWDIARKPAKPAAAAPAAHPIATHAPRVSNGPRRGAPAARPPKRPLREKRREQRRRFLFTLLGILVIFIGGALYTLWMPAFRVDTVEVQGANQEGIRQSALSAITGVHWYGVPRNSIFALPEEAIRANIVRDFPDVSAVSIKGISLHAIGITVTSRASAFIWCGASIDTPSADGSCFSADGEGLVFGPADPAVTSASSSLRIFAPLDRDVSAGESPVGAHIMKADQIPDALRFVKAARSLGAPVSALAIQQDEADLYLQGPTRIRYVLGREEQAAQLAASVLPNLNLTDGTIEYVDLRFIGAVNAPGKAYVKRFGE